MTRPTGVDWVKAERFYRAGIITIKMIAEKCHCSRQAIEKRAKREEWTRDLHGCIGKVARDKQLKSSIVREATNPSEPGKPSSAPDTVSAPVDIADVHAREDEALVEAAAREHAEVTRAHRVEAARLIGITRDLGGKLVDLIQGRAVAFEAKTKDGSRVRVPFLGEHESAADALGKVTRALKHLVDIERKAFGIDEQEKNPEKRRDMVPLEERLAQYRREEVMAEAGNVVKLPVPASTPIGTELVKPPAEGPTLEEDKEAKMSDLNMYGEIARDYLEEHSPQEFQRLQRKGQLNAHLIKAQRRVGDLIQASYEGILERNPPPDDQMKHFQAKMQAHHQAVEIVLSNEFPPRLPPDEIEDEIPAGPPDALIET